MSYRADKQVIDTHTHTDAGDDNTRRPKLALGKKHGMDTPVKSLSRSKISHH